MYVIILRLFYYIKQLRTKLMTRIFQQHTLKLNDDNNNLFIVILSWKSGVFEEIKTYFILLNRIPHSFH